MKRVTQFAVNVVAGAFRTIVGGDFRAATIVTPVVTLIVAVILSTIHADHVSAQGNAVTQKVRRVKRVKRPVFNDTETNELFFRDLSDALVGERPDPAHDRDK